MDLIFRNLIKMPVILTFFNTRDLMLQVCDAHPIKLIVT